MSELYKLRIANKDDFNFILSTWLKSYRSSRATNNINNDIYYSMLDSKVKHVLNADNTLTLLAVNPEDDTQIYGYTVVQIINVIPVLHYVYVKHSFRKFGIASHLLNTIEGFNEIPTLITHEPKDVNLLKKYKLVYNPYLF